ncbi:hypothetical protein ACQKJ1_24820 [Methylorubrum rhodesianum]|uniref:hypothetical protein n=1 Tax=Methylorubrum rhodesianum TaxID=29427 RepID=UPI003D019292
MEITDFVPSKSSAQEKLEAFLHGRFEASKAYQEAEGRQFDITWEEYLGLWKRKRYLLNKVRDQVLFGNAHKFMASDDGIVLTWKDKATYKAGIVNATTMEIKTKEMSKRVCHMQVGDHHTRESIEKIRAARTNVPRTKEAKEAISDGLKGKPKSDEHKAKMAEAARKRWERYRAEKANTASR